MTEPIWEQVLFMPLDSDKRATSQYDFLPKIKEIWYENPNLPMLISPLTILQKAYENKLFIDINLSPDKFFIFPA